MPPTDLAVYTVEKKWQLNSVHGFHWRRQQQNNKQNSEKISSKLIRQ